MSLPNATIKAAIVRRFVEFADSRGAARPELLRESGLAPDALLDGDARVAFSRYVAAMRAAKVLCNDPALALHFGEEVELQELSLIGMTGGASPSLEEGFAKLNRHAQLDVDFGAGGDRFRLSREEGALWIVDQRPEPNAFPEFTESFFARAATAMRRLGDLQLLSAVDVTHPQPPYVAEYARIFGVPVRFGATRNALQISPEAWSVFRARIPRTYAADILRAHADAQVEKLEKSRTMRGRVEALVATALQAGGPAMADVARHLGVSRQTLFRKLKSEGTTFEQIVDEVRHRLALQYLRDDKLAIAEAAYRLGFSDPAAFSRAFKRWTGQRPAAMRDARDGSEAS